MTHGERLNRNLHLHDMRVDIGQQRRGRSKKLLNARSERPAELLRHTRGRECRQPYTEVAAGVAGEGAVVKLGCEITRQGLGRRQGVYG